MNEQVPDLPDPAHLQQLLSTETLDEFLSEITMLAVGERQLSCGITVYTSQGRPYTLASSDDLAGRLDEAQYRAGGGPCMYALEQAVPVSLPDMAEAARWPKFQRQATAEGVQASLSVPMSADHGFRRGSVGALNLYTLASALNDDEIRRAHAFAEHVSGAVTQAARLFEQQRLIEDLQAALVSRTTIDQAIGIVMGEQHCGPDEAFDVLRRASQNCNIKVDDLAGHIITRISGQAPEAGPFKN